MDLLRRHPRVSLAFAIWLAYAALETWIAPQAAVLATIWAAHGLVLMLIMKALLDRAPQRRGALRIALFILAPVAFTLMQTSLDGLATRWIGPCVMGVIPTPGISPIGLDFNLVFKLNMRVYLWIFVFYAATLALLDEMYETYAAKLQMDRAELDALRLQVNPHFLFNALNSISSLILQRELVRAETMTTELARFYRTSLTMGGSDLVELDEEIEALEAYINVEVLRFQNLAVTIDCPSNLYGAHVPRLILQPLIENAVKFGGRWREATAPITVDMSSKDDALEIRIKNDFVSTTPKEGTGTGLRNVRDRLRFHFGDRATLASGAEGNRWRVVLTMPLLFEAATPA
jgi:sensor histidine kinase YesM